MFGERLAPKVPGQGKPRLVLFILSVSLAAAVVLKGGVEPGQWEWIALAISVSACLSLTGSSSESSPGGRAGILAPIGFLLEWFVFQMTPLPPAIVAHLSPLRWSTALAARLAAGEPVDWWLPLSIAPAMTMERLLFVVPALAAFVATRELGRRPGSRMWWTVAPVIAIAALEGALGLVQFLAQGSGAGATGTYVNRNHFAGLLEMALPLSIMWPVAAGRRRSSRERDSSSVVRTVLLVTAAGCIFCGLLVSFSRAGLVSALVAIGVLVLAALAPRRRQQRAHSRRRWRWVVAPVVPLSLLLLLTPSAMVLRLGAAGDDAGGRVQIWRDTLPLVAAYKWTGSGLGTYERALYAFKTVAPMNTVDFAHNDYLQVVAELGLPGAMLVAALGVWIVWSTVSVVLRRRGHRNWELAVGLLGAFVALGLHGFSDFNLYIPANALTLAWLGGVAVSAALRERETALPTNAVTA